VRSKRIIAALLRPELNLRAHSNPLRNAFHWEKETEIKMSHLYRIWIELRA